MSSDSPMPDSEWLGQDPLSLFTAWLAEAKSCHTIKEPTAMSVATADAEGLITSRVVLLKSFGPDGFVFYTNYESEKGRSLLENPVVSMLFYWDPLGRQVRVNGTAQKTSREVSVAYWNSRPYDSRLSQYVSSQTQVVPTRKGEDGRDVLKQKVESARASFDGRPIPCPDHWGGFVMKPNRFEFWQGRVNRLHDRFRYSLDQGRWSAARLYP